MKIDRGCRYSQLEASAATQTNDESFEEQAGITSEVTVQGHYRNHIHDHPDEGTEVAQIIAGVGRSARDRGTEGIILGERLGGGTSVLVYLQAK